MGKIGRRAQRVMPMQTNPSKQGAQGISRRILFLGREHDEADEATGRYLENCGHEVALAENPSEAMSEAEKLDPQILICDLHPQSDDERIDVAMRIRDCYETAVVIITNYHRGEVLHRFPELRGSSCLRKPVSLRQLAQMVSNVPA